MANKKRQKGDPLTEFIRLSGMIMTKVGVVGFIVIAIVGYVYFFVPQDIKNELTNTWLLFKCDECNNQYIFLFVSLVIIFFIQWYFYHRAIKMKDKRIDEVTKEKSELQNILLAKQLKSTKKR